MRYGKEAMNTLRTARENNPNVSQRRFARNIYALVQPGWEGRNVWNGPVDTNTPTLSSMLGHPSEVALAHLIRGIDRKVHNDAVVAATVTNSATLNRKKARTSRARKTVGTDTKINPRGRKTGGLPVGVI